MLGKKVIHRFVLGSAVVPHNDRTRRPVQAYGVFRSYDMLIEKLQQTSALQGRQVFDMAGEEGINVKRFLAGFRVGANQRMLHGRVLRNGVPLWGTLTPPGRP